MTLPGWSQSVLPGCSPDAEEACKRQNPNPAIAPLWARLSLMAAGILFVTLMVTFYLSRTGSGDVHAAVKQLHAAAMSVAKVDTYHQQPDVMMQYSTSSNGESVSDIISKPRSSLERRASGLPACRPTPWAHNTEDQLLPFAAEGITANMIEEVAAFVKRSTTQYGDKPMEGWRVLIHNGQVYAVPFRDDYQGYFRVCEVDQREGRPCGILPLILKALCRISSTRRPDRTVSLPDMELFLHIDDGGALGPDSPLLPIFSWGAAPSQHRDLLVPYGHFVRADQALAFDEVPWEQREPRCFWRGTTTGAMFNENNWREQARTRLVQACKGSGGACDAQFTQWLQITPGAAAQMQAELGLGQNLAMERQSRYQCLIVVDGNSAPSSRLARLLSSGSAILLQQSPDKEFFYGNLQPYVHYIPVSNDLSDLMAMVKWTLAHPEFARRVGQRAKQYAAKYLNNEVTTCYMVELLSQYGALLRYKPTVTALYNSSRMTLTPEWYKSLSESVGHACPPSWLKHHPKHPLISS